MSENRTFLDRDLLVAYVDGELPPDRVAAVDAALVHDAEAWETVRLLRLSAAAAAHALGPVIDEPMPARLLAAAQGRSENGNLVAFPARHRPALRWPVQIAASLAALAIGFGAGYVLHSSPESSYVAAAAPAADPLAARFESALLGALDKGAQGESFTYDSKDVGQGRIELGRGFTTGFGADCREFRRDEFRGTLTRHDNGVACRGADKSWSVMLLSSSA